MIAPALAALKAMTLGKKLFALIGLVAAIIIVVKIGGHFIDANNAAQRDLGAATTTADALTETLERTEKANEAAENIIRDADARRTNCLRHSRTPENCE